MSESHDPRLAGVRKELLVALVFAILASIGSIVVSIFFGFALAEALVAAAFATAVGLPGLGASFASLIPLFLLFVLGFVVTIVILVRVYRMYGAASIGDIATLKRYNSVAWAILALVFSGIIPGILLLVAHGPIDELGHPQLPQRPQHMAP